MSKHRTGPSFETARRLLKLAAQLISLIELIRKVL
jgi:hypothetical protein